jgi:hypothetical protein
MRAKRAIMRKIMTKYQKRIGLGLIVAALLFLGACLNAPRMAGDLFALQRAAIAECKDGPKPGCYARGECVVRIKITLLALQDYAEARAAGRIPAMTGIELAREVDSTRTYCAARGVVASALLPMPTEGASHGR